VAKTPLVYAIGLDSLMARALYADLRGAAIRRRAALKAGAPRGRRGHPPDLILLDLGHADGKDLLATARQTWGTDVLIVGLRRDEPQAYVWKGQCVVTLVEIGPGFLSPYLPWAERKLQPTPLSSCTS
jgi:hypothetical protein